MSISFDDGVASVDVEFFTPSLAALVDGKYYLWTIERDAGTGTIKGHIKLTGPIPANPIIRMGVDPLCSRANGGKRLTKQIVVAAADGSLANVVVQLEGNLPAATGAKGPRILGALYPA